MKILLRKNIRKLGRIGELVEVRDGYARNYLLPQRFAVVPTKANLKAVEVEKQRHLEDLARMRGEIEAKAQLLRGREITITAQANEEGHLYGSVGPAQIVAALAAERIFIEPENVVLDDQIRQLDKYDVEVRFTEDIAAVIHVWVLRARSHDELDEEPPAHDADQPAAADSPDPE